MKAQISIIGRVGRDCEMKFTPSGQAVGKFSVASSRKWEKDGEKVEETTWFQITVWGKRAEVCNQYVKKGMLVSVDGRLTPDDNGGPCIWEKDGIAHASFEVTASDIIFLSKTDKKEEQQSIDSDPF